MTTLVISDLHLDASRPHIARLAVDFIRSSAAQAAALYILGDLFEAWTGDDSADDTAVAIAGALATLHESGVPAYFIHGNRDFLLGDAFARHARLTVLPDASLVDIEGTPTLLMHGDALCTGDARYQEFRSEVRAPVWQRRFLARPPDDRREFAGAARAESRRYGAQLDAALADVAPDAVAAAMRRAGVTRLIHGHTHRPAIHRFTLDGQPAERIVLGDWYTQGSVLTIDPGEATLRTLAV